MNEAWLEIDYDDAKMMDEIDDAGVVWGHVHYLYHTDSRLLERVNGHWQERHTSNQSVLVYKDCNVTHWQPADIPKPPTEQGA